MQVAFGLNCANTPLGLSTSQTCSISGVLLQVPFVQRPSVVVPTTASQLMISGTELPGNPPRWVGAVVLVGYAALLGLIGTLLTKRRDIS